MREGTVWTTLFVLLGLGARAVRWRGDTPLWGDEAAVALNLVDRGYHALAAALDLGQYGFVGRAQTLALDGSGAWLARFWSDSLPPPRPLPFLAWLARTHTGMMRARVA